APHAALHLVPVPRRVAAPQRIVRGMRARLGPEVGLLETAQERARLVPAALLQLAPVLRGVRPPGRVGLHLGDGVPLVLEGSRCDDRRGLLPPVVHLEARGRGLHGEGDRRALPHFLPLRRLRLAPRDREGEETDGADARSAHPASWEGSATDGVGFEPTKRLPVYALSRRVPSAARPPIPGSNLVTWRRADKRARRSPTLIAGRHDARSLYHEHHRALGSPRAVPYAAWHDEALARRELDRAALQVDDEPPRDDVEELVLVVVLVPVVFPLHHTESHHGVVDLAERLGVPGMGAGVEQRLDVDELERPVADVEVSIVGIRRAVGHGEL